MFNYNQIANRIQKRECIWKKKSLLFVLIFVNLLILITGGQLIWIAELDETNSLLRNYVHDCINGKEVPFMSYGQYLVNCYKHNLFESFILVPFIWVAIVFIIDIIDDLINFPKIKKKMIMGTHIK